MHVRTRLTLRRHTVDRAHRLAVHQNDSLIAHPHRRLIALEHQRLPRSGEMHLQQRTQIFVIRPDAEHPGPAGPEQRLDDNVLVFPSKRSDGLDIPRDQRRRHQVRKMRHQDLFRRIAHRRRVIDDQRSRLNMLQQMGGRDIGHVERRILAHQNDIHAAKVQRFHRAERVMRALTALNPHAMTAGK